MNLAVIGLVGAGACLTAAVVFVHPVATPSMRRVTPGMQTVRFEPIDTPAVPEFAGYRRWAKVNTTPQYVFSKLDMLCVGPTQAQLDAEKQDPHVRHYMLC